MTTKKAYIIGTDAKNSLSPLIFNHWFKKHNVDAKYTYKTIKEKNFNKEINKILKEENLCGINVTMPFKEKIIKKTHQLDKHSKKIGSANCITIKNNKYYASNTDWIGFGNALVDANTKNRILKKKTPKNAKTILIGYGGAAKAVLYSLLLMNYKNIVVFNRSKRKIYISKNTQQKTLSLEKISDHIEDAHLIINTTPGNIFNDLKIKKIEKEIVVCDIVYRPKETSFLKHFVKPKAKVYGIDMLINQAIPCFYKWFGTTPSADNDLTKKILKKIS